MADADLPAYANPTGDGAIQLRLKVIPGSSRSSIAGPLGDRLKIKVAAPPEDGRANQEVIHLLKNWTGARDIAIVAGATHPEKTALVRGAPANFDWRSRGR